MGGWLAYSSKLTVGSAGAGVPGAVSFRPRFLAEAADFLAFASGEEGSKIMAGSGAIVPANLAALHSPAFAEPSQFPRNSAVFDDVIRRADPMPSAPGWPDVVSQTQPFLDRMFYSPVLDLDTLLPRIDEVSAPLLAAPTASPSATP